MKIAVIVCDATAMMHTGADIEREVAVFDVPEGMAEFIKLAHKGSYTTLSFGLVNETAIAAAPKLAGEES